MSGGGSIKILLLGLSRNWTTRQRRNRTSVNPG